MSSWGTTTSDTSNISEMDLRKFLANNGTRFLIFHCAFKYLNHIWNWKAMSTKPKNYERMKDQFRDSYLEKSKYNIKDDFRIFDLNQRQQGTYGYYTFPREQKMVLFFYDFILKRQKQIQEWHHCSVKGNLMYDQANMFGCPKDYFDDGENNTYDKRKCCKDVAKNGKRLLDNSYYLKLPDFPDLFKNEKFNEMYKLSYAARNIVTNDQNTTGHTANLLLNQENVDRVLRLFLVENQNSGPPELSEYRINKSKQTMQEFHKKYKDVNTWTDSQRELLIWNAKWNLKFKSNSHNLHNDLIKHIFRGVSGHVIACFRTDSKTRYGSNSLQKVGATISTAASNTKAYLDDVLNATASRFGYVPITAFSDTNVASQLKNLQYKESQKFRQLIDWICDPEFMICIVESCWYMLDMVARKIKVIEKLSPVNNHNRNMEMYRVIQNPYAIKSLFESVVIARYNYGNFSRGLSVRSRISNSAENLTKKAAGALTGAAAGYLTGGLSVLTGAAVGSAAANYMMPSDYSKSLDNRLPYFKMISEIVSLMYSDFFASKISAGTTTLDDIKNMII